MIGWVLRLIDAFFVAQIRLDGFSYFPLINPHLIIQLLTLPLDPIQSLIRHLHQSCHLNHLSYLVIQYRYLPLQLHHLLIHRFFCLDIFHFIKNICSSLFWILYHFLPSIRCIVYFLFFHSYHFYDRYEHSHPYLQLHLKSRFDYFHTLHECLTRGSLSFCSCLWLQMIMY